MGAGEIKNVRRTNDRHLNYQQLIVEAHYLGHLVSEPNSINRR